MGGIDGEGTPRPTGRWDRPFVVDRFDRPLLFGMTGHSARPSWTGQRREIRAPVEVAHRPPA